MDDDIHKDDEPENETISGPEREELDPALPKKALENLHFLFRGNGLKHESIKLKGCEGDTLKIVAYERFKVENKYTDKHVTGREQGDIAGSFPDVQQKMSAEVERITLNKDIKKQTLHLLKKREDLGFAIDDQIIRFDRMNKKYIIHEPCAPCDTSGKVLCQNCHGKTVVVCPKCHGERQLQCPTCHGSGFVNVSGEQKTCTQCHGRTSIGCDYCHQTGEIQCPKCKATGKMECLTCHGAGWSSHVFTMGVRARSVFDFEREGLPETLEDIIDDYRGDLVNEEHAFVRVIEEERLDAELDRTSDSDEYIIPYEILVPWADISFLIKGNEVKGNLFGFRAYLTNMVPILEKVVAPGLRDLAAIADGKGTTDKLLNRALRYRIVREAFKEAIDRSPNEATEAMIDKYPYAIERDTLQTMVINAGKAMTHITHKPRLKGLGLGLALSAILNMIYFFGPIRNIYIQSIPDTVMDFTVALLSGTLATITAHLFASNTLKNALEIISDPSEENSIKAKISQSAWLGIPAGMAFTATILILGIFLGKVNTSWLM